jgi:amidase
MPLGDPHAISLDGLRVAYYTDNGIAPPTSATAAAVRAATTALADAGSVVNEDRPSGIDTAVAVWDQLFRADGGATVRRLLAIAGTSEMHPTSQWTQSAPALPTAEYAELLSRWNLLRSDLLAFIKDYDILLCPVCAHPAIPHGAEQAHTFSYTKPYNLTGWPAGVVRAGTSPEGLPIGVQIVGRPWQDQMVLAVAAHLEEQLGGWRRPPL